MDGKQSDDGRIPQPGADAPDRGAEEKADEGGHPTSGPGGVSVDEPTDPALEEEPLDEIGKDRAEDDRADGD